jgi:hypothetical protein
MSPDQRFSKILEEKRLLKIQKMQQFLAHRKSEKQQQ